jgi:hypothetical protein
VNRIRLAVIAAILFVAPAAHAQLPSTYSGAAVLPVNTHVFGAYVPLSSNAVGALAQLRLSFLPGVDFGFQGGLSRLDRSAGSKTLIRLGTDVKAMVAHASSARPLDMAIGGALGIFAGDDYNLLSFGPTFVVSRTWQSGSSSFSPYVGAGLTITTINVGDSNNNDFSLPLRFGAELGISPAARLVGEFTTRIGSDFGDDSEFTLGVNLPF